MDLSLYIRMLRRWLWLIILAAVAFGSFSFATARVQPERYTASTTLQIGRILELANPDMGMINQASQLGETYVTILRTTPILEAVVNELQLPITPRGLAGLFDGQSVPNSNLLIITVTYTDPIVAADIANELARQLIANSPTDLSKEQQEQLNILQNEIREAQAQLQRSRDEQKLIEASLNGQATQDQAILIQRKGELITEINNTQSTLASMSNTVATLQQRGLLNTIRVIEPASIPTSSFTPTTTNNTTTAALLGAGLAAGFAFLIEYLNNSIRSPAEVMPLLNLPLLGSIPPFGNKRSYKNKLITWIQPRSTISESFRALRINLLYREDSEEEQSDHARIYLVTSSGPSEGKSITISNLAITFANTGMRVLLIDTDLRRPSLHLIFNLNNTVGLSNIWGSEEALRARVGAAQMSTPPRTSESKSEARDAKHEADDMRTRTMQLYLSHITQKTEIPNLSVISSGPLPSNPAELLDSAQMRELVRQLKNGDDYDIILFDTPPVLVATDCAVVGNITKAKVVLVVESGRTHRGAAIRSVQSLLSLSISIVGVVMNRLNPRDRDAEYGYYYYYGYSRYGQPQQPGMPPMMQPGVMQPGMMQPGMMQPGVMQPGMMQPPMQQPPQQTMQQSTLPPGQGGQSS